MKHLRLWESHKWEPQKTEDEIAKFCKLYGIKNWSFNSQGLVDVDGDVDLSGMSGMKWSRLPIPFGEVRNFSCNSNRLTSLQGAPRKVNGCFYADDNLITTLVGGPEIVAVNMILCSNKLTTLEGAPKEIGGNFDVSDNWLKSLEYGPQKVGWHYYWYGNIHLTSLEGAPQKVYGNFGEMIDDNYPLDYNNLHSLKGCPKIIGGNFLFYVDNLTSFEGLPQIIGGESSEEWIIKHFIEKKRPPVAAKVGVVTKQNLTLDILKTLPDYALTPKVLSHVRRLSPEIYNLLKQRRDESQRWKTDLSADLGDLGF